MKIFIQILVTILLLDACFTEAKVYFHEQFDGDEEWEERWVESDWKRSDNKKGYFECSNTLMEALEYEIEFICGSIITSMQDKFYAISTTEFEPFEVKDRDLIVQFSVLLLNTVGCGGNTIKLLPEGFDQKNFNGDTPYLLNFGPDICGSGKKPAFI
jgi:calreticulin